MNANLSLRNAIENFFVDFCRALAYHIWLTLNLELN